MTAPVPVSIRASANENPFPPPPSVLTAIREASGTINRYPEAYPDTLAAAIAAHHGVTEAQVAVGAGGAGLIQQMLHLTKQARGEIVIGWRSFEGYPLIANAMKVPVRRVPLRGAEQDLLATAKAVRRRSRVVFVCNPNNPTGTPVSEADVNRLLGRVSRRTFVVLDEVYRDFTTEPGAADGIELLRSGRYPNLIVLRSFSKAYGLADLRLGYALGPPGPIAALRGVTMPFLVSTVSQRAALAALAAEPEYQQQRATIAAERDRVAAQLRRAGYSVPNCQGNFVWLPLADQAADFGAACAEAGMQVHAFDGDGVRVSIGDQASNEVLLRVAEQFPRS
ncbi:aminotransferase class I/II-fold pyridoxal phosphate-dependent enzyme [Natronosporangium hydrolyticum]|uniref:Aminotransferase class I/II-fold pyridoxal phosphate-dependent enzyme n=1 Tax=Natronosporangium hydrolyticum TaxID=2811111 RepID=A0A895YHH9_9ACTN|nr:aminotransferase class I/II-fold pyridoxal phosphate-dependent enzyme [Natronosporangium hydrolyticum]QSB13986.1 aminotransferase class I/II-fold pyridoxal phosphate-dependent enzyme [Natronosporangium hydrolyticum]